uniref:Putative ovule protein n=1 Tax=Solanum chacoense TaxID=4108 RepID=A0A0V0HC10_SOLCH
MSSYSVPNLKQHSVSMPAPISSHYSVIYSLFSVFLTIGEINRSKNAKGRDITTRTLSFQN